MAERRMFSKRIIGSARFLRMPGSTQALYFHLGMAADDDGIVEAYPIMQMVNASEDDLRLLAAKGFVKVLNEDLVTYILDWQENNKIRADRKVNSIYKDLLLQVMPETPLLEPRQRADRVRPDIVQDDHGTADGQPVDDQMSTTGQPRDTDGTSHGQPMDNHGTQMGPHRIGKDRIGKDRLDKGSIDKGRGEEENPPPPNSKTYGEFQNVNLSDEEYQRLKEKLKSHTNMMVEKLSRYMQSSGKTYQDHYATLLHWYEKDEEELRKKLSDKNRIPTIEEYMIGDHL